MKRATLLLVMLQFPLALFVLVVSVAAEKKPAPKPCLTSGCTKITLAYTLGSAGTVWAHAINGEEVHTFEDKSGQVAKIADTTGYVSNTEAEGEKNVDAFLPKGCYDATQKPTPSQLQLIAEIVAVLKANYYKMPDFFWTVLYTAQKPECLNSSSIPQYRTVFIYTSLANALHWDRDALAAVIAHEVGHLQDKYCGEIGQNIVANAGQTPLQQVCEKHADNIGIQYVVGAQNVVSPTGTLLHGVNPNGFTITFQTLQGISPTGAGMRYSSNHPINADRITNVKLALEELCRKNIPNACQYAVPLSE